MASWPLSVGRPTVAGMPNGAYNDRRSYRLPRGWAPVEQETLDVALAATRRALAPDPDGLSPVADRIRQYYDPGGRYAGALHSSVEPNDPYYVTAADLFAVTTLSMSIDARQARLILMPGARQTAIARFLRRVEPNRPITDLTTDSLDAMFDLQGTLRSLLATDDQPSNHWVFAAKLMARKRPLIAPVRDNLVCAYLTDGRPLGDKPGRLGYFQRDIQVFAYLMTSDDVRSRLCELRDEMSRNQPQWELDESDLRLLDVCLWTAARPHHG